MTGILKAAVKVGRADQVRKFVSGDGPGMEDRHGFDVRSFQQGHPQFQAQEALALLVINVELEEVMRKLPVVDRVPGIHPFAEEDVPIFQPFLQDRTLHDRPLLEQIVLRDACLR